MFLKISQNPQETHESESLFNEVVDLRRATLLKRNSGAGFFPVNFEKFLKIPFLIEHLWWLLLKFQEEQSEGTVLCKVLLKASDYYWHLYYCHIFFFFFFFFAMEMFIMERALRNVSVRKKKYRSTVLQEVPHFLYFETDVRPLLEDSAN